jgi:hypothetical protein
MLSYFLSTYVCERLFTITNLIKSKDRNVLTDEKIAACVSLKRLKFSKNIVINL